MNAEFDAICIRSIDYKDNDKILTLYATSKGKIAINARGCKKEKAKLKYAATPFCFGKYYVSTNGKTGTLTGCDLYDSFFDLTIDPYKFYAGSVVLELMDKLGMEEDYNASFFVVCLKCLKELCYTENDAKKTLFTYLKEIMLSLGYEVKAITLLEYYNYLLHILEVKINSLKELISM